MNSRATPPSRLHWLLALDRVLATWETVIASVIFVVMLALMVVQVIARYFLEIPLPWSEELIRYLFVMSIFIGAAAVSKYREHIEINFVETLIASIRDEHRRNVVIRMQMLAADVFSVTTLLIFCWYTVGFVGRMFESDQRSPAMGFPTWIVTGVMLLGVLLMIVHYVVKIVDNLLNGYRPESERLK